MSLSREVRWVVWSQKHAWAPFIGGRRECGRCTGVDGSPRCRQWSEEGVALACAAGDGVLLACTGAMGGIEAVWFRGG
jgi:hypothetical protein